MPDYFVLSDEELSRHLQMSDVLAFKELHTRYYKRLCFYIGTRVKSQTVIEDLVQDIFFKIWRKRKKLNIKTSFRSYIYQIANHRLIDYYRKNKRQFVGLSEIENIHQGTPHQSTEIQIDLSEAIKILPEKLQTAFILSRFDGLS